MYPIQQVDAYSPKNKKYRHHRHFQYHAAAKTDNNDVFFIGNQQLYHSSLPSMHRQNYRLQRGLSSTLHLSSASSTSASASSSRIRFDSHLLPTTGHTLHWIDNTLASFFGKPNQPSITLIETKHSSSYISSYLASPSPSGRYSHTTTRIRNRNNMTQLYLIGGSSIENDEPLADIWKLDWQSKTWINLTTPLGPFETGLMGHVTLDISQQSTIHLLTCFGASHHQHIFNQHCTLFNTDSLVWKQLQPTSSSSSSLSSSSTTSASTPSPRIYCSMVSANGTHAILYGGLSSTSTLLDDIWWVDLSNIDSIDNRIMFTPLAHSIPRAGHVALMISDSLMLVDGGEYDGSLENERTVLDLASLDSSSTTHGHQKRDLTSGLLVEGLARDSIQSTSTSSSQGSSGISGGTIGGIIVAVVLALGGTIALFVFYQRRQRRQRNYDLHSRAARFSLSTPPRPSESYIDQQQSSSIIQHPEAAKTRLSHMSFGSEFYVGGLDIDGSRSSASSLPARSKTSSSSITPKHNITNNNHPNMLDSPSRQLYTNWVCETPVPQSIMATTTSEHNLSGVLDPRHTSMYINQSTLQNSTDHAHDENNDDDSDETGVKKRSSTALKRLRLSIFRPLDIGSSITEQAGDTSQQDQHHSSSAVLHDTTGSDHQPTTSTSKRRSSMFGLSRFLNIGDSATGDEHERNQSQDDELDQQKQQHQQQVYPPYHRHHYQTDARTSLGSKSVASLQWVEFNNDMDFDSGLASRHLAVMNNRQSVATISSSSGFGSASVDDISLGSKPTSPRNTLIMAQQQPSFYQRPHHPSSTSSSYRLGHRELQSWDDARISRLASSPPPPTHLLSRDPTKTNSFPTLAPLNID